MEKLRRYLNSLTRQQQFAFAEACGTSVNYLRKALSRRQRFDGALCRLLDENSHGHVPKAELRPDIWPELASQINNSQQKMQVSRHNNEQLSG